jgi:uracil-DNA glycosylase
VRPPDLAAYLAALAARPESPLVANPYRGRAGARRLQNLRRYLEAVAGAGAAVALVGEAPGYRGCAVTGIPLTSRAVLSADLGRWGLFAPAGFAADASLGPWRAEATATVVWRLVPRLLPGPPLLANAFPFHPHPAGRPGANRGPTAAEVAEGAGYLRRLLARFPGVAVVAIGRRAARALTHAGATPAAVVRHPAHGGAAAFAAGLSAAASTLVPPRHVSAASALRRSAPPAARCCARSPC